MNNPYEDILFAEPPKAPHPMPQSERAAQFSPFAALTGFEETIEAVREAVSSREWDAVIPVHDW